LEEKSRQNWLKELSGMTRLDLPASGRRPPVFSTKGDVKTIHFPEALAEGVEHAQYRHAVTPFMTFTTLAQDPIL